MADEIFVGSVAVGVVPDARGWNRKLAADLIPSSDQVGREYGQRLSRNIVDEMGRHRPAMAKEGERSGGAFADTFRKRIDAAIKTLPKAKIDGDSSDADRKLEAVRVKLEALSKKKIGIDIDSTAALKEVAVLEKELDVIGHKAGNIDVRFNTVEARAQLALLKHQADKTGSQTGISLGEKILGGIGMVGSGAAPAGGAPGGIITSPYGLAIAGALGLLALPFIAEAASGLIVAGFGGMLGAMAAVGAARNPEVAATFHSLKDRVMEDLEIIGQSWVNVLEGILNTAKQTMDKLTPTFERAASTIAGPFRQFAETFIRSFGQPEVQASIQAIAVAFAAMLKSITPQVSSWMREIAGAITQIAGVITKHPEAFAKLINFFVQLVVFVLRALAVLTELAVYMTGRFSQNIHSMADTWDHVTSRMAIVWNRMVSGIHRAWGDFVNFWVITGHQLEAAWNRTCSAIHRAWSATTNFLHRAWSDFINFFVRGGHQIEATWNSVCNFIHRAWSVTVNFLHKAWSAFVNFLSGSWHNILAAWNTLTGAISRAWNTTVGAIGRAFTSMWNNVLKPAIQFLWNTFSTVFGDIINGAAKAFGWIPGIGGKLRSAASQFNAFRDNVNNSLSGIKDRTVNVGVRMSSATNPYPGGISGRAQTGMLIPGYGGGDRVPILAERGELILPKEASGDPMAHALASAYRVPGFAAGGLVGGFSLSGTATGASAIGKSIWDSVVSVVKSAFQSGSLGSFVQNVGSGVSRWSGIVLQALGMLGMSSGLLGRILYQMKTESGGNPNAINLWDINAQRGDPSKGLMQVIGSTFAAYHVAGTSGNIYDPLANIAAAINYARHVYGPSLGALGSGHGYADGGPIVEPIVGFGLGTGLMYRFGEKGREWVSPGGSAPRGGDGSATYHAHFDGLTGAAIESHVRTAFQAMAITDGSLQRQGRRS